MYQQVKLDELCVHKIETISSDENGLIDYFDIASIDNTKKKIISHQSLKIEEAPSRAKQIVQLNDILVSTVRPNLNAIAMVDNKTKNKMVASTGFCVLRASEKIEPRYLFYFVQSPTFINSMTAQATGASYPAVSNSIVKSSHIPLPDLSTQRHIADTLDKVSEGVALCRKMMDELELMVKAKFQEMFGDVFDNSKNFGTCLFGDYASQMNIGPFGSDLKNDSFVSKENGYCMVYEQKHAIDKNMLVKARYVTEEKYQQMKRFDIGPGDIIVSCRGTIGKCFILPDDAPHGIIHPSLMMIKPKNNVNHTFLLSLLESILKEQQEQGTGVKMAIKASELAKIKCIAPPRELQDSYVTFVSQINKSKLTIQGIRDKMEMEKLALMQEYFG